MFYFPSYNLTLTQSSRNFFLTRMVGQLNFHFFTNFFNRKNCFFDKFYSACRKLLFNKIPEIPPFMGRHTSLYNSASSDKRRVHNRYAKYFDLNACHVLFYFLLFYIILRYIITPINKNQHKKTSFKLFNL